MFERLVLVVLLVDCHVLKDFVSFTRVVFLAKLLAVHLVICYLECFNLLKAREELLLKCLRKLLNLNMIVFFLA